MIASLYSKSFQMSKTDEEVLAILKASYGEQTRDKPSSWLDRNLDGANQPVVGVCWYEALAYCQWLTFVLRAAGRIRADQEVALPNEPEWEKAARFPSPLKG